jgi:hypothetical protein
MNKMLASTALLILGFSRITLVVADEVFEMGANASNALILAIWGRTLWL